MKSVQLYYVSLDLLVILTSQILNSITEDLLDHKGSFKNPVDQCEFIRKHFECGGNDSFIKLCIHTRRHLVTPPGVNFVIYT